MKNDRQTILLEIIEQEAVETQEQLLRLLAERGVKCTQATVSRDIKQLHLVKEPTGQGRYRYAVSVQKSKLNFAEKLRTIFRECVLSVEAAQNLVVLKTIEGMAQGAAFTWATRTSWARWPVTTPSCWCSTTTCVRWISANRSSRCCGKRQRRVAPCWKCSTLKISPSSRRRTSGSRQASTR